MKDLSRMFAPLAAAAAAAWPLVTPGIYSLALSRQEDVPVFHPVVPVTGQRSSSSCLYS